MPKFQFLLICLSAAIYLSSGATSTTPMKRALTTTATNLITFNSVRNTGDCDVLFDCKKHLEEADPPKPCLKFCVDRIVCANDTTLMGKPDECMVLNEKMVAKEYHDKKKAGK